MPNICIPAILENTLISGINNAVASSDACIYIVSGEKESCYALISEEYQKLNSSIEVAAIPEAKHLPHLENPELFLEQVSIFM